MEDGGEAAVVGATGMADDGMPLAASTALLAKLAGQQQAVASPTLAVAYALSGRSASESAFRSISAAVGSERDSGAKPALSF